MDVLNQIAQIGHSLPRRLSAVPVGMMHIPQSCHGGQVHLVNQSPQALGIGVNAVGLYQQANAKSLRDGAQKLQGLCNEIVIHLALGTGIAVAQHADKRCAQLFGQDNVLSDLGDILVKILFILQAATSR